MTPQELEVIATATARLVQRAVLEAQTPLLARIADLEVRQPIPGPAGERGIDGRDGRDGKDGKDGREGIDGSDGAPGPQGQKGLDGQHGQDGRDGFSFDDFSLEYDGERSVTLVFERGDVRKTKVLELPHVIYREVFVDGQTYARGDAVTWGGSLFIAKRTTTDKPGTSDAWQLAAKRGREGKEGKSGPPGERGPRGERA